MWTTFTLFQHAEIASVNIIAKSKNKLVTTIYPKNCYKAELKMIREKWIKKKVDDINKQKVHQNANLP